MERVAVVIATKDRPTEITLLLQSLINQTYQEFDVFIVDGSQTPIIPNCIFFNRMITHLRITKHKVVVTREELPGVCQARNQLAKLAKDYEWHFRVDDDSILEPDVLERLIKLTGDSIGAIGGVVPLFGQPVFTRNIDLIKPIASKIETDTEGNITKLGDDLGYNYNINEVVETDHVRSSFLYRYSAWLKVNGFPIEYGLSGFREESDFSLKLKMEGYKLLVDTGAIIWHNVCAIGGVRAQDYADRVRVGDELFRRKVKNWASSGRLKL